ncbi:unnamed protein product [Adineta steineri]|uniref:Uncharacterized protein n=1 Tax=Adineta steineri TaxID=433720 RepID=A0A814QQF3_9BILA|nr:unnamed protein product [Adineta steineri]CAF1402423.1 unnamed protein product [Adineta steineri]
MRWTIVIVAIFALVTMVTSNVVYDNNGMEEMNSMGANVFLGVEHNQMDAGFDSTMHKRNWREEERRRRRRHEECRRHRRC